MRVELGEEIGGRLGDLGAGAENRNRAGLIEGGVIAGRDHAAGHDENVRAALLFQLLPQLGNEREVARGKRGHANDVDVVFNRNPRDLAWRRATCIPNGTRVNAIH